MQVELSVFEAKAGGEVFLTALGLGADAPEASGRHAPKVATRLVTATRVLFERTDAAESLRFQRVRGTRLIRARLDFVLDGRERRHTSGVFPLVVEPRHSGVETDAGEERILVVYHPKRQQDVFWVPVDAGELLGAGEISTELSAIVELAARRHFRRSWAELSDESIASLRSQGKERLTTIAFSAEPKGATHHLPAKASSSEERIGIAVGGPKLRGQVLSALGVDLTQRLSYADRDADVRGRPDIQQKLGLLLGGTRIRPALLVGPSGAGKTNDAHAFAATLLEADGFVSHRNLDRVRHVWEVSGRRLIAGMSRLGEWEKRVLDLLDDARRRPVILFVPDLAAFGWLGRSQGSDRCFADLFTPPVARGEIKLFGEATREGFANLEREAPHFASLFTVVPVREANRAEALHVVLREVRRLEPQQNCQVRASAIRETFELGDAFYSARPQPARAVELLTELVRVPPDEKKETKKIGAADVQQQIQRKTGLSLGLLIGDQLDPREVETSLGQQVVGQQEAIGAAVDLVARIRSGLTDPKRPFAVYLFTGPTGTGKTELCKALAEYLFGKASALLRFDMGEFSGADAVARLTGDAYVPEGILTERVQQQPFGLILFDEVEKAHPSALHLLLQIFEDGRLTDARGRTADFTRTAIVMTSNLGTKSRAPSGFGDPGEAVLAGVARAVKEFFPPELFNRIDRIVPFTPLSPDVVEAIAWKELARLLARRGLVERNIYVQASARVAAWIAGEAHRAPDGARSIKRLVEEKVGAPLTDILTSAASAAVQILRLDEREDSLTVAREEIAEAPLRCDGLLLEPLVHLSSDALRAHLQEAQTFVVDLEQSDAIEQLSARIGEHLRRYRETRGVRLEDADAVYNLDAMRRALAGFRIRVAELLAESDPEEAYEAIEREQFGFLKRSDSWSGGAVRTHRLFARSLVNPPRSRFAREEILEMMSEVHFLRRALTRVDDHEEHAITVELRSAFGAGEGTGRFERPVRFLLSKLVRDYQQRRGEVERVAWMHPASGLHQGGREQIDRALEAGSTHIVFELFGLGARDACMLEAGSHLFESLAHGVEMVAVRLHGEVEGGPVAVLEGYVDAVRRFEGDSEGEQGDHPGRLPPLVRRIRLDPPESPGTVEIEDFALGYASSSGLSATMRGGAETQLDNILNLLFLLSQSRIEAQ